MFYSGDEYAPDEITSPLDHPEWDERPVGEFHVEPGNADHIIPDYVPLPPTEDLFVDAVHELVELHDRIGNDAERDHWITVLERWEKEQTE